MLVTRSNFQEALASLLAAPILAIDTETTGLRPYHGDRLFSIAIASKETGSLYLNFMMYPGMDIDKCLGYNYLQKMKPLFDDKKRLWYGHNIKFDLHMLGIEGVKLEGKIHDTQAIMRLIDNNRLKYSLDSCVSDCLGKRKDDAVEAYISKEGLWEWRNIPGKKDRVKDKFYSKVPFEIIMPYAEKDAALAFELGEWQRLELNKINAEIHKRNPSLPSILEVYANECALTPAVLAMEQVGAKIDKSYCEKAILYYQAKIKEAEEAFLEHTNITFKDSGKVYQEVFSSERDKWVMTVEKRSKKPRKKAFVPRPCFDSDVLTTFTNPVARIVLDYREAKSHKDFFTGFLYHADSQDRIHTNLQQDGTVTGRFSSNSPNLQNMSKDKDLSEGAYSIKKAFVNLSPDYMLCGYDYKAVEYRLMICYAGAKKWAEAVKAGVDLHEHTGKPLGITRDQAKGVNFGLLYGCGITKLASMLKTAIDKAKEIKDKYFENQPEVYTFIKTVSNTAKSRGYIVNWLGRRSLLPKIKDHTGENIDLSYKMPNALIQGSAGDVTKVAIVRLHELLKDTRSKMFLTVHDAIYFYIHREEHMLLPKIKEIMEACFPTSLLTLEVSGEQSQKNLYEMEKI